MRTYNLLARNLRWYWRTNLAVLLGVATAAGVLGGAALVGESVRASLREIALGRLGSVGSVISREGFLRADLAAAFPGSAPAIVLDAAMSGVGGRHASGVQVYGVDERFWRLQSLPGEPPAGREAMLTEALSRELAAKPGDAVLLRVRMPSAIPRESLHGRKDDVARTIRLTVASAPPLEFSLRPQQGELKAVYVSLARLQSDLNQAGRTNTILLGSEQGANPDDGPLQTLRNRAALADFGLSVRILEDPAGLSLESDSAIISDAVAQPALATAKALGLQAQPVLTYLANSIAMECAGTTRACPSVPYSVVTALDSELAPSRDDGIVLNEWTARNLGARPGDKVTLEYYVWRTEGQLETARASFRVERVVPIRGAAADRNLAPTYPGITESRTLHDWDPPFPLDLTRVRDADERYWTQYGATPKAFIRLERGRQLWGTRFGSLSSIRVSPPSDEFAARMQSELDPAAMGISLLPVRSSALEAARGATNFGEYFLYFSFFLIVSALLLTGLFFRLGIEQRAGEIGTLRSLGFSTAAIRTVFLLEGAVLAVAGAVGGILIGLCYGGVMMVGLRTWWIGAAGTGTISLHGSIPSLALGAAGGVFAGLAAVALTLRSLGSVTPRSLVTGQRPGGRRTWHGKAGTAAALVGAGIGWAAFAGKLNETAGFFGAGTALLTAALLFIASWLQRKGLVAVAGTATLGLRSMAHRRGRSVLCISLIASATFTIVSIDVFRREGSPEGAGGYSLLATSDLPLLYDLNSAAGREALNLGPETADTGFVSFRLKPGDDTSCLNLYRPVNPRILAPPAAFLRQPGFAFQNAAAGHANPWLLLEEPLPDGAVPAIADANSMTYNLHLKLGDEFVVGGVRYRMVAALRDSIFQGELLISEANFLRLFPDAEGYRYFLLRAPKSRAGEVARLLEESLSDYGFDVQDAEARLASFHQVENTYLSMFRALGSLGLLLGTVGLAAILLRNVLERRRELALLRAVGYHSRHLVAIMLWENTSLLVLGLVAGTVCALMAVIPVVQLRGGQVPVASLSILLGFVLATGVGASLAAMAVALRAPMLETLKAES